MPILTHQEKVFAPRRLDRAIRRDYILCTRFGFRSFAARAASDGFASVSRLDAGHDAQVTHPAQLAHLLTDTG